ncbi:putative cytochrome P450 monooxygenase, partial [Colletotrichum sublineola]
MIGLLLLSCAVAGLLWVVSTPLRTGLWPIPGPWWRRYTDIFQVLDAYNGRTCQVIKSMQQRYGPVVLVGPRTVIFSDPVMIDKVYATRNPFPKSHHWMPLRTELKGRPISGVYAMSNVVKSEAYINEHILLLVKKLHQEYNGGKKPFPVYSWMHYFAYDTIMKLTVSKDFGLIKGDADREGMFKGVDAAQTYRAMASCMPWVHGALKGSPITKVFEQRMGSFPKRARELIQARRASGAGETTTDGREDLLTQILATREKHPEIVDERVVHGYVTTPLLAGADTVTIGLTSVVYFVSRHPSVAAKLCAELDTSGLASFRCHPVGAMLSRRAVPPGAGLVLADGRRLPAGTAVAVSGYATHFNTDVYGDDVDDFRPERWLQGADETDDDFAERVRKMNKADLTWDHGDHACMGKNIARCEMYKLVATLYSLFDIRPVDPNKKWKIKETVLAKQEGVEATIRLRSGASLQQVEQNIKNA